FAADGREVVCAQRLLRSELAHVHRFPPGTAGVSPAPGTAAVSPAPGTAGVSPAPGSAGVSPAPGTAGVSPAVLPDETSAFTSLRHPSIHARSFACALLTCTRTVDGELPKIAATSSVDSSSTSRRITAKRSFGGNAS